MSAAIFVPAHIRELRSYRPAARTRIQLDANECSWPLPEEVRRRFAEVAAGIDYHRYPDATAAQLRAGLAARFGGSSDEYVVGNGSDELIVLLLQAIGARDTPVLIPFPTFVMYEHNARTLGRRTARVPLTDRLELDIDATAAALRELSPALLFLATPNNPTGHAVAPADVARLAAAHRSTLLVVDEAYGAYSDTDYRSLSDEPNVGFMGTRSKAGLAGIRCGYARLPGTLAEEVDKVRQPFNLDSFTMQVATLALTDLRAVFDRHAEEVAAARADLHRELDAVDWIAPYPSSANFILCKLQRPSEEIWRALRERGIGIKNLAAYGPVLENHVRITVGTPDENGELITALREL
ncbi:MAG: aminotransferase class I/II-fold pyridoxal phosphate-dependent enzyme [Myxococcota bacterium]